MEYSLQGPFADVTPEELLGSVWGSCRALEVGFAWATGFVYVGGWGLQVRPVRLMTLLNLRFLT